MAASCAASKKEDCGESSRARGASLAKLPSSSATSFSVSQQPVTITCAPHTPAVAHLRRRLKFKLVVWWMYPVARVCATKCLKYQRDWYQVVADVEN